MKKRGIIGILILFFLLAGNLALTGALETNNILLKVSVKQGDQATRIISIASVKGGEFTLDFYELPGVVIRETEFLLDANEKKQVEVIFDSKGLEPGVHVGKILITGGDDSSNIPVIFEVEAKNVLFDVNVDIPPEYNQVEPGGKLLAQVKIFDLTSGGTSEGLGATNVDTEYYLFDLDGNVLSSETEGIVVEKQARITKTLTLPSDIKQGDYVFVTVVRYRDSLGASTQLFSVISSSGKLISFDGNFDVTLILMMGLFAVIFLTVIFLFIYLVKDRDKMLIELRRYNTMELRNQQKILFAQERFLVKRKDVDRKAVKAEIKQKVKILKTKQKERVKEFKKLRRAGNAKEMMRKLNEWKRQGYNTMGIESKLKESSVKEMSAIIKQWKKEGYNIGKGKPKSIKR